MESDPTEKVTDSTAKDAAGTDSAEQVMEDITSFPQEVGQVS